MQCWKFTNTAPSYKRLDGLFVHARAGKGCRPPTSRSSLCSQSQHPLPGHSHLSCLLRTSSECTTTTFVEVSTKAKMPIVGLGTWKVNTHADIWIPVSLAGLWAFSAVSRQSPESGIWGGESLALELGPRLLSFSELIRAAKLPVWLFSSNSESFTSKYQISGSCWA